MKNQKSIFIVAAILFVMGLRQVLADTSVDAPKAKPTETVAIHLTRHELLEKLQVTSDQKKLILHTRAIFRKKIAELDGQLKVKKVELESELEKPEPDAVKLDALTAEIGGLYGQRLNARIKASLELEKKILTPQQADLLKSLQVKESAASDEIF